MTVKISDLDTINDCVTLLEYTREAILKVNSEYTAVLLFNNDEFDVPEDLVRQILAHEEARLVKDLIALGVDPNA